MKLTALSKIKPNPSNPRYIRDDKFAKLVKSLKDFPEMIHARPLIVNKDMEVLGGNMRLRAMIEAKWKETPVIMVDWSEEKQKEFIVKDNASFGEWDWDVLANEWEPTELKEWGLDVWQPEEEVDYSILDQENLGDELQGMADGVKKAIQIEFNPEHYDEAWALVAYWREAGANVGKMVLDFLKAEKARNV